MPKLPEILLPYGTTYVTVGEIPGLIAGVLIPERPGRETPFSLARWVHAEDLQKKALEQAIQRGELVAHTHAWTRLSPPEGIRPSARIRIEDFTRYVKRFPLAVRIGAARLRRAPTGSPPGEDRRLSGASGGKRPNRPSTVNHPRADLDQRAMRDSLLRDYIEQAISAAGSTKLTAVHTALRKIALAKSGPFTGMTSEDGGLLYDDSNNRLTKYTKSALSSYLRRRNRKQSAPSRTVAERH
jgi:hypothetical protein